MQFKLSTAPHTLSGNRVRRVMGWVLLALVPALLTHLVFFGYGLLINVTLAAATGIACEALALRLRGQPLAPFLSDGSVIVTGTLLAFCIPPLAPWWLTVSGTAFAVLLVKHLYGGLGRNTFNPAMVGYVVLLVSFPVQMTRWPAPLGANPEVPPTLQDTLAAIFTGAPTSTTFDAITTATPIAAVKAGLTFGHTMEELWTQPIFGHLAGRGWEMIALATLAGGVALLVSGVIRWQIPVAMLASIAVLAGLVHAIDPGSYPGITFHLLSGATMLGAFFIATDPVTAATSERGRLVYGACIGVLTYIIRTWGGYNDGVAFAVLLMNSAVPLLDRYTVPRIYGEPR
jgi:electron transport complex protein RnfD